MSRLPQPGGDQGTWGSILNDFLAQAHNQDGSLKANSVTSQALAPGAVTLSTIADGSISETKLDAASRAKLNSGGTAGVTSVNTRTGDVTLAKADVGLRNVDNTADADKPISTATQAALNAKVSSGSLAPVATSGSYNDLTGKPTIPAAQVNSDWNATSGVAQVLNKPTIPAQFNPVAGTNVTLSGAYPNITISATPGAGVTDLSTTRTATNVTVASSGGR